MKNIIVTSLLISMIIFYSCKEKATNPPDTPLPEGYQQDIPWTSLADSPWPMNHHDPQNTGRSIFVGPKSGTNYIVIPTTWQESGVSIGKDSSIYFATMANIFSYKLNGQLNWQRLIDTLGYEIFSTPLVSSNGNIFVVTPLTGRVSCYDGVGTMIWTYKNSKKIWQKTLAIDKVGNLYFVDAGSTLVVLSSQGQLLWSLTDSRFMWSSYTGLVFSPDGKTLYTAGFNPALLAIDISQRQVKWGFGNHLSRREPMVDAQGNIYLLTKTDSSSGEQPALYSLKPDGTVRWVYIHKNILEDGIVANSPTIDKNGNIYFAFDSLYSVDYQGKLRWKQLLPGIADCPLVCDAEGMVYAGSSIHDQLFITIKAFNSNGALVWENNFPVGISGQVGGSPAILNSRLIFPAWRSREIFLIQ
ncbi:MAG: hypothetical protein COZ80_00495 [Ignavibacteria bacterium CG_4_8_14_3_um_filter_37_9]|nr:PQQ-binding-like beta-propeller repeat protein [Ignavibacteria bacterium]OIO23895.1 MAG: hypothetical protein AUJ54_00610 [Ignavibacteria bacterium CG1_02_37_35]PIP76107.1 MAG: hypothetical protein COW85_15995 [Ignavibacteria bacterium CG22_combo_CG10-13_8_21_14_all_37_15]PIX00371.1 MAG: hypothetical protein COZ80_00495 [Ignavibacteria bacterium CG_4_8_14_3_um_filter_37_9]PIX92899.1 MAG: hypothetical protein COZ25_13490 [Ignavibacteria bacterium CG_4_10_14_3_um_filter_37_18]PJC58695.1 MAG: 